MQISTAWGFSAPNPRVVQGLTVRNFFGWVMVDGRILNISVLSLSPEKSNVDMTFWSGGDFLFVF